MMKLIFLSTISCWLQTPQKYGKSSQIIIIIIILLLLLLLLLIPLYPYSNTYIFILFSIRMMEKKKNKKKKSTNVFPCFAGKSPCFPGNSGDGWCALSKSSEAPVVIFSTKSSSAARPPSATAILSRMASDFLIWEISVGIFTVGLIDLHRLYIYIYICVYIQYIYIIYIYIIYINYRYRYKWDLIYRFRL